jgi:fructokinase
MNVITIGEILWDVVGDTEHLGGAPFNFAAHLGKLGHAISFISAVGADERGHRILDRMSELGLSTRYVRIDKEHSTGIASVTLDGQGQPRFAIPRPAAYDFPEITNTDLKQLLSPPPDWISFGTLLQMSAQANRLTLQILDDAPRARRFYDVNLRPNCYEPSLVHELLSRAAVVKLNDTEASEIMRMFGGGRGSVEQFCRRYAAKFKWEGVCVTRGPEGCEMLIHDEYVAAQGYPIKAVDTIGAGDAFAAAFVHGIGSGWPAWEIADFANRVGAVVASYSGAIPNWTIEQAKAL